MGTPALAAAEAALDLVVPEAVPRSGLPKTFIIGALVCTIGVLDPSANDENIPLTLSLSLYRGSLALLVFSSNSG